MTHEPEKPASDVGADRFARPFGDEYTDGRKLGEWASKYEGQPRVEINREALRLAVVCVLVLILSGSFLSLSGSPIQLPLGSLTAVIDFRLLAIFFVGALGGVTFSIKWLIHSVAKCSWHLDRRYWRYFVPLLGGVYACVVLALLDAGMIGAQSAADSRPLATSAALAFLVGYFSDGVSGLLSNIAGAVFGTLKR